MSLDVWLSHYDFPLPVEDARWLSGRLRDLSDRIEGAADAASVLEAALGSEVSREVALDVAEIEAVRTVLAEGDGRVHRSQALLTLAERLELGSR
jgi:hypothetical protein